jgi:hypothetical protein
MRMDRARNSRRGNIDSRHHDSGRSASRCGRAWGCGERAVRRGGDHAARIRHRLDADGQARPASARTIDVGPGQRYDVIRTARKPGNGWSTVTSRATQPITTSSRRVGAD